ncbi:MAG: hypothetical protein ACRC17_00665 [Culicoidibacterales bacterium]
MNNQKWGNILEEANKNGFSVQCINTLDFNDQKSQVCVVVKILDNDTLEELLSIANHAFSYGNEQGLYESWSKEQRDNDEDPTGYLTEQQVITQIQNLKGNKNV